MTSVLFVSGEEGKPPPAYRCQVCVCVCVCVRVSVIVNSRLVLNSIGWIRCTGNRINVNWIWGWKRRVVEDGVTVVFLRIF